MLQIAGYRVLNRALLVRKERHDHHDKRDAWIVSGRVMAALKEEGLKPVVPHAVWNFSHDARCLCDMCATQRSMNSAVVSAR